jgi:hypothetical protein
MQMYYWAADFLQWTDAAVAVVQENSQQPAVAVA